MRERKKDLHEPRGDHIIGGKMGRGGIHLNVNDEQLANSLIHRLSLDRVNPDVFPSIDLYMDQVTTFMESQLKESRRYEEDKVLTKTMINNYAKNDLFPSPPKKRYSKAHLFILVFIYFLKGFISIRDIRKLLAPISKNYFDEGKGRNMSQIYASIYELEKQQMPSIQKSIEEHLARAKASFPDASPSEQDTLHRFALICSLGYDVYLKKTLIERLIDEMPEEEKTRGK